MSLDNFIPAVWAANLISTLDKVHVTVARANRQYEGEISSFGDTVKISQIGDITVSNYVKNSTVISPQELTDAQTKLIVDQSKMFAFKIDDIDSAQQKPKVMTEAMRKSAVALSDVSDKFLLGLYAQAGLERNTDAAPVNMTSLNVDEEFLAAGELMDEASIPREGRFAIIQPWVHTKIVLAGITSLTDNVQTFTNSFLGRAFGFNFFLSNSVSDNDGAGDKTRIICGVDGESFAFADQIVSVEGYRPESSFSDAVKGLHLYAGKIIRPDKTLVLYADKTAEA